MSRKKGQIVVRTRSCGLRARAWWVLRKNKTTTLEELQVTICDGTEKNAGKNLHRWLHGLTRAGVLSRDRELPEKLRSGGSYRYTLLCDLGPLAPVIREAAGEVFDPNAGNLIFRRVINAAGKVVWVPAHDERGSGKHLPKAPADLNRRATDKPRGEENV